MKTTDQFSFLYTRNGFRKGPFKTRQERKSWLEEYLEFIKNKREDLLAQIKGAEIAQKESRSWDRDGEYYWVLEDDICGCSMTINFIDVTEKQILKLLSNM
jgi:ribosomal 30S subunit maturation factor RimM